jgi:hypothetical protein
LPYKTLIYQRIMTVGLFWNKCTYFSRDPTWLKVKIISVLGFNWRLFLPV